MAGLSSNPYSTPVRASNNAPTNKVPVVTPADVPLQDVPAVLPPQWSSDLALKVHGGPGVPQPKEAIVPVQSFINRCKAFEDAFGSYLSFDDAYLVSAFVDSNAPADEADEDDGDSFDVVGGNAPVTSNFNGLVYNLWGAALINLDVVEISPVSKLANIFNNTPGRPLNILATPQLVSSVRIVRTNKAGMNLKSTIGNTINVNTNYFFKHIEYRNDNMKFLKLGLATPLWTLTPHHIHDVKAFWDVNSNSSISPIFSDSGNSLPFIRCTLWNSYAVVLSKFYQVPIVVHAIALNWKPLFLFKNMVGQRGAREPGGCKITLNSCDTGALTSINLVGFWKGQNENLKVFSLVHGDCGLLTRRDVVRNGELID